MSLPSRPVGTIVATEEKPATPHRFHFRTSGSVSIGIGSIVRVDGGDRVVYGVVEECAAIELSLTADAPDAPSHAAKTKRQSAGASWIWTASVLRHVPEEPLQPVPLGPISVASDADLTVALRMDSYAHGDRQTAIPIGLYGSGGNEIPVFLDADFLVGPEAAHLSISGISGLATKTSVVEFLLAAMFRAFPASKGSIAAVCFNLKGPDLLFLDQPGHLTADDLRRYERLGLSAEPFERVRYFAPFKPDGVNLNTLRTHQALMRNVEPLVWGLREVLDFAEVLLNRDDLDAKADAFVDFLADRVVNRDFSDPQLRSRHRVQTFADLEQLFREILDAVEQTGGSTWRTHHIATIRKLRNRLSNISTRSKGLVTDDGPSHDLPWGRFEDRTVYVIDLANVDPVAQNLVFARVVSMLRERMERRDLGVDHVVVFVDELNKYAAADPPDTYVKEMLLDIAERGRYLGLVLFGAQQFRSQVHRRIVGNAATVLFGRMDMDELATPGYQVYSRATKGKMATLPKGELMVRHPHFTQPIFLRFPRPPVLRGPDGVQRFPPAPDLPFDEAVEQHLLALDRSVSVTEIRDAIAGRREEDVRRALGLTRRARPSKVLPYFLQRLGANVAAEAMERHEPTAPLAVPDDPYAS